MRISLSVKVFLLFSTLTAVTLLLGITVYSNHKQQQLDADRLLMLKDFVLDIQRLEALTASLSVVRKSGQKQDIPTDIQRIRNRLGLIRGAFRDFPPAIQTQLSELPELVENYRNALMELTDRYMAHDRLPGQNKQLFEALREAGLSAADPKSFYFLISGLWLLNLELYHTQDMSKFPALREIRDRLIQETPDAATRQQIRTLVLNLEANHVNYLALRNRQQFLEKTSDRFFGVARDAIRVLSESMEKRHAGQTAILVSVSVFAIFLNLLFWALASRYFARFIREQKRAIQAIETDDATYGFPSVSNDEIGDLSVAMRQLSATLRKNRIRYRESEEKYRTMMEVMPDPVYICSPDFRVEYMNPAMIRRVGGDVVGRPCYEALHGLKEKCPWCQYHLIDTQGHFTMDIHSPKDDRNYSISSSAISRPDGRLCKLSIYRDVTELNRLETQLAQSQKMESIGTLAGGIAHDFNNILFPILGYTEMLLEDAPDDSTLKHGLDGIHAGALRAKELVRQILTFSRQGEGELRRLKIQPIIKEALKLIRSSIPATVEIDQDIRQDCGPVTADPTQIHQIIMNLATNAYQAMQDTGGLLRVSLRERTLSDTQVPLPGMTPGRYNCLTVSDTGVGIRKKVMGRIFDPFFTTKEKGKGTGMGLSVVHGIVARLGGAVDVESAADRGTTFRVWFPVAEEAGDNGDAKATPKIKGGSERILLVDDEPSIVTMMRLMLSRMGYYVTGHTDSTECLEHFREDPSQYDLVISDLAMPKLPGDELAAALLAIRPDIPILINTGFGEQVTPELAEKIGIRGILMKPIVKLEMARAIRRALDENVKN